MICELFDFFRELERSLPTEEMIQQCIQHLQACCHNTYGELNPDYAELIGWVAKIALDKIAKSDAAYHNVEHTIFVSLVGQEILRGKFISDSNVSTEDWLHFIIACLCHDIGYIKGVCRQDQTNASLYATGMTDVMISLSQDSTDASLTPFHVERSKLFVEEYFGYQRLIKTQVVKRNIELTRFPIPSDEDYQDTVNYPGLVRAADFIGQFSDPRYLQKLSALWSEFEETGTNKIFGYRQPKDLRKTFPNFYSNVVFPYIQPALSYLKLTRLGQQIIANLEANVLQAAHE